MASTQDDELASIERLVADQSTLVLSTSDADGQPCAAALFYIARPGLELYWYSSAASLHSANLHRDPRASVAVSHPTSLWNEIRGVQMRGIATPVEDRTVRRRVAATYRQRFKLPAALRLLMARTILYAFRPSWVRYIDNTRGFGFRFETSLPHR